MGTKNKPGKFDCYAKAEPNEPMFTLLGRDPVASFIVGFWIEARKELGLIHPEKLQEAEDCARAMKEWAKAHGKSLAVERNTIKFMFERALKRLNDMEPSLTGSHGTTVLTGKSK